MRWFFGLLFCFFLSMSIIHALIYIENESEDSNIHFLVSRVIGVKRQAAPASRGRHASSTTKSLGCAGASANA